MQLGETRGKWLNVKCKIEGCNNGARSAGYCINCYNRLRGREK